MLRSRGVELAFLGLIPQRFTATQLLYRSTDMNSGPEAAVTTVLVPMRRDPELICPLVSYQCAIDAVRTTTADAFPVASRTPEALGIVIAKSVVALSHIDFESDAGSCRCLSLFTLSREIFTLTSAKEHAEPVAA